MEQLISNKQYLNDHIARSLFEDLSKSENELFLSSAIFYYDFPSFRDYEDDVLRPKALLLSPDHGIIAFNFCDSKISKKEIGKSIIAVDETLTQFYSILYGRLLKSRILRQAKDKLIYPLNTMIYSPALTEDIEELVKTNLENTICNSFENLKKWLISNKQRTLSDDVLNETRSIIEGSKALTRTKTREIPDGNILTKAGILSKLEEKIANFDAEQRNAAITFLTGPERIRGLAGTGKTIVLAMKAAQLHLDNPDKIILYTFYTKSLYDIIKQLITRFYRHYKDSDPNWDAIKILHAWGGSNLAGVYYRACIDNGIRPLRWKDVPYNINEPFDYICEDLLKKTDVKPAYDYVLIDEGQDMPENFFKLCFKLTYGDKDSKNIVWAYDELQNIFDVKVKTPKELFGTDNKGEPLIDLERASSQLPPYLSNDIVLYKSYRNPKEVLITAHALGFGLYSDQIVQMLENKEHWEDIGYQVIQGDFKKDSYTIINRPDKNSPLNLLSFEEKNSIIKTFMASNIDEEITWVIQEIMQFLKDGLKPEDILIITLDDKNARRYFEKIQDTLSLESNMTCNNILNNPYTSSRFIVEGMITLSTVHRAKGNEAAAVFAIGIDALYQHRNSRTGRNRIFAALTRTKAWLRVSGVGKYANYFLNEINIALEKSPNLEFPFPDLKQVNTLQRDISKREAKLLKIREKYRKELQQLGLQEEDMLEFFVGDEKK